MVRGKAEESYLRLDEMATGHWRPVTVGDLRRVAPIKLTTGTVQVERYILALLLGERERLQYVAQAARWLAKAVEEAGLRPEKPNYLEPGALEKAINLLEIALATLEQEPVSL